MGGGGDGELTSHGFVLVGTSCASWLTCLLSLSTGLLALGTQSLPLSTSFHINHSFLIMGLVLELSTELRTRIFCPFSFVC